MHSYMCFLVYYNCIDLAGDMFHREAKAPSGAMGSTRTRS